MLDAKPRTVTICGTTGCGYTTVGGEFLTGGASVRYLWGQAPHVPADDEVVVVMRTVLDEAQRDRTRAVGLDPDVVGDLRVGQALLITP